MDGLQLLFQEIDKLPPEDFERLYRYVLQRRRALTTWGIVPPENLRKIQEVMRPVQEQAAKFSEDEINADIDRAIAEVRRERKAKSRN